MRSGRRAGFKGKPHRASGPLEMPASCAPEPAGNLQKGSCLLGCSVPAPMQFNTGNVNKAFVSAPKPGKPHALCQAEETRTFNSQRSSSSGEKKPAENQVLLNSLS